MIRCKRLLVPRMIGAMMIAIFIFNSTHAVEPGKERQAIEQWRVQRIQKLTSPTGWLTLVGLYWLQEGDNTFGRKSSNRLVLDHAALPATLGTFAVHANKVKFIASDNRSVTHAGKPISSIDMTPDSAGEPTIVEAGTVQFFVIERAGKLGVRVRDTQHPLRTQFKGLKYFPISAQWAIDAKFERYEPVKYIEIMNILGMTESMVSPGAVVFNKEGHEWRLDTVLEAPGATELFVMFADATSGRETYGAGRFLYIPLPQSDRALLDFNKAYNPPCAFSGFATCPLPPRQNRLALRVAAGEKKYSADH